MIRVPRSHVYIDEDGVSHRIDVQSGVDQGCPASNPLAPISIADAHEQLSEKGKVFGLQDDTCLLAPPAKVAEICQSLGSIFKPSGTRVNALKSWVKSNQLCDTGGTGITLLSGGPKILKLPVPVPDANGALWFDATPFQRLLSSRRESMDRILALRQSGLRSQTAFLLTRFASSGDANYVSQCIPMPDSSGDALDETIVSGVHEILNIDFDANANHSRWFMAWREGGMGLQSVSHAADALLMASWMPALSSCAARHNFSSTEALLESTPGLQHMFASVTARLHAMGIHEAASLQELLRYQDDKGLAKKWREIAAISSVRAYDACATVEEVITRKESGGKGAAGWLMAPRMPKHKLTDQALVTSVRLRLHLPVFENCVPCRHVSKPRPGRPPQLCSCECDIYGRHALLCNVGGHIVKRHNALRDDTAENVQGIVDGPVYVEQHDHAYTDNRHPDINFQNHRGETAHVDVMVVTPHVGSRGGDPRQARAGALIAHEEAVKRRKYAQLRLMPAVCSHLGRPGKALMTLFRSLAKDADEKLRSAAISSMWQSWSCILQKYNCFVLSTAGPLCPP